MCNKSLESYFDCSFAACFSGEKIKYPASHNVSTLTTADGRDNIQDKNNAYEGCVYPMTLATIMFYPDDNVIFASDSRSTKILENGEREYSDDEQKIFPIEDSPIVLVLSGNNRFGPNNRSIRSFVFSHKGAADIHQVKHDAADFLLLHSYEQNSTRIALVDITHSFSLCEVFCDKGQHTVIEEYRFKDESYYLMGADWAVNIAKRCPIGKSASKEEIERIRNMYGCLYNIANIMRPEDNVVAPPTKVWVGHLDGTIEEV